MPEKFFRSATLPDRMLSPYFDPTVRIPLYQAALGDELITTHHWIFGSFKFKDISRTRELMEILYMIPPMYHLNVESWQYQRDKILKHLAFWSPLHKILAPAKLTNFECLSSDRLVQRTTFETDEGEVFITVNFSEEAYANFPPMSATVSDNLEVSNKVYELR